MDALDFESKASIFSLGYLIFYQCNESAFYHDRHVCLVGTMGVKSRRCALMDFVYIIPKNVCRTLGLNNEEEDRFGLVASHLNADCFRS